MKLIEQCVEVRAGVCRTISVEVRLETAGYHQCRGEAWSLQDTISVEVRPGVCRHHQCRGEAWSMQGTLSVVSAGSFSEGPTQAAPGEDGVAFNLDLELCQLSRKISEFTGVHLGTHERTKY